VPAPEIARSGRWLARFTCLLVRFHCYALSFTHTGSDRRGSPNPARGSVQRAAEYSHRLTPCPSSAMIGQDGISNRYARQSRHPLPAPK